VPDAVLQQTLESSVEEVLEKMFFFSAPEEPGGSEGPREPEIAAQVGFVGVPPGVLKLRVTRNAALSIAADFLAVEARELHEEQVTAVVCELANVICGSVLSRIGSAAAFRLGAPRLVLCPETVRGAPDDAAEHTVEMFGGALTVAMAMDAPACSKTAK
jgi:CheY-specific phosphatase CheX